MTASRIVRQFGRLASFVLAISLIVGPAFAADDSEEAWAALVNGGHVALIRHGNAPPGPAATARLQDRRLQDATEPR